MLREQGGKTLMKFHNSVSEGLRSLLRDDLQRYIKEVQITGMERQELFQWVQAGNSPYDNGWNIADDAGTPMDYIGAKRVVESGQEFFAAYDPVNDEPIFLIQEDCTDNSSDEGLPF